MNEKEKSRELEKENKSSYKFLFSLQDPQGKPLPKSDTGFLNPFGGENSLVL